MNHLIELFADLRAFIRIDGDQKAANFATALEQAAGRPGEPMPEILPVLAEILPVLSESLPVLAEPLADRMAKIEQALATLIEQAGK